jgi:uncharacterized alpha-E superfamily protein
LPQKQNIEEWQGQVEKSLAELQSERKQAVASHNSKAKSLQSEIDTNANVQASLRAEVTSDPARQASIISQLNQLAVEASSLRSRLNNENTNYANTIASFDAQIKYTNENLEGVKQQDQDLLDNVATVNGSVSIQWISLYDIAHLYLPGYWIPAIFLGLAILAHLWNRRRQGLSLQAVT